MANFIYNLNDENGIEAIEKRYDIKCIYPRPDEVFKFSITDTKTIILGNGTELE